MTVPPIEGHKAESERLGRLTEFLCKFAPAIGESCQTGRPGDDVAGPAIVRARDAAIVAAFRAVARLADESFNFQPTVNTDESKREPVEPARPSG